jgi:hypothetical protein
MPGRTERGGNEKQIEANQIVTVRLSSYAVAHVTRSAAMPQL